MTRALRCYRRLVRVLLPAPLRFEIEDDLIETCAASHGRIAGRSLLVRAWFWLAMAADLAGVAVRERMSGPPPASRPSVFLSREPHMRSTYALRQIVPDLRLAVRRQLRHPFTTLLGAGTLALGVAASVVATVLVRDLLLRPLAFPEPDRLVRMLELTDNGRRPWWPSFPNAADWREHGRMFEGVGIASDPVVMPVLLSDTAVRVPVARAGRGLFETLGVRPLRGRFFTPQENSVGGERVAIVSERLWRTTLASRPLEEITITVGTETYTAIGVLPQSFRFLGEAGRWQPGADVWTPLEQSTNLGGRTSHGYHVVARLRPGITLVQARADTNVLADTLRRQHGGPTQAEMVGLTPLGELVVRRAREPLQLLLYAAAAVLALACLNLAAAILAQLLNRSRELTVRLALGASRVRLMQHVLTEAAALAIPGALLGVCLSAAGLHAIRTLAAGALPRLDEARLDAQAMLIAVGITAAAACLAGIIPSFVLSRRAMVDRLRTHGATTNPRTQGRLWTTLVLAQVALTVPMLAGTALLMRSFTAAMAVDLGYDPKNVLTVALELPATRYAESSRRLAYFDTALERLRALPGVRAAGLTSVPPHDWSTMSGQTYSESDKAKHVFAGYRVVDPGYFAAAGIRVHQGDPAALRGGAALIDRKVADTLWSGYPTGERLISGQAKQALSVAGIVGTVREWYQQDDVFGAVYVDFHHHPERTQAMHFLVRHDGSTAATARGVRDVLASIDPFVPVTVASLQTLATESLASQRLLLTLTTGIGVIALLLTAAGVYALVAFSVQQQTREAAIRLALGAKPNRLRIRVLLKGVTPALAGLVLGLAVAVRMRTVIESQLFQIKPSDTVAFGGVVLAVVAAAILSSALPARRVSRVEPSQALRLD